MPPLPRVNKESVETRDTKKTSKSFMANCASVMVPLLIARSHSDSPKLWKKTVAPCVKLKRGSGANKEAEKENDVGGGGSVCQGGGGGGGGGDKENRSSRSRKWKLRRGSKYEAEGKRRKIEFRRRLID